MSDGDGIPTDDPGKDCGWVRMAEVTHDAEPEVNFEFFIDERPNRGWVSYPSQRIADFFD